MPLAPPPLEKGRSARACAPAGDPHLADGSRLATLFDPHPPRPATTGLGDLTFSRGGGSKRGASCYAHPRVVRVLTARRTGAWLGRRRSGSRLRGRADR